MNQVTSFWTPWGCSRGEGDCHTGKGNAVVLQEVCTEVSHLAAHVASQYKAGCGKRAAQLRGFTVLGAEGKEESTSKKNNRKWRTETTWGNMETSQTHSSER